VKVGVLVGSLCSGLLGAAILSLARREVAPSSRAG